MHDVKGYLKTYLNKSLDEYIVSSFQTYYETLIEYNNHTNLTSIVEPLDVVIKHFYDSVWYMDMIKSFHGSPKVLDVGSGAGFPGVPLKLINKEIELHLLDSVKKKTTFLEHLKQALNIKYTVHNERAETHLVTHQNTYDIITFRAVGTMDDLLKLCLPMLKVGGIIVALKSLHVEEELQNIQKYIKKKRISLENMFTTSLPEDKGLRNVIVLKKLL
jgi:16S rRNA (guanine527-N7)-methyltransferase